MRQGCIARAEITEKKSMIASKWKKIIGCNADVLHGRIKTAPLFAYDWFLSPDLNHVLKTYWRRLAANI